MYFSLQIRTMKILSLICKLIFKIYILQHGMNNKFYKGLIHCYGKSYIFVTRNNQINSSGQTSGSFISEEVYNEDEFNNSTLSP